MTPILLPHTVIVIFFPLVTECPPVGCDAVAILLALALVDRFVVLVQHRIAYPGCPDPLGALAAGTCAVVVPDDFGVFLPAHRQLRVAIGPSKTR